MEQILTKAAKFKSSPKDFNSIAAELRYAGDRASILERCAAIDMHLRSLGLSDDDWELVEIGRAAKRNFAQKLSTALAQKTADYLRPNFKTILPDADGNRHESRTMGAGGLKKIDVNYSTPEIGLGLAISVKTINFMDEKTRRFTKNVKRIDGELRAEAEDVHKRQPYAVVAAIAFVPREAAFDSDRSSVKHLWEVLHRRAGRETDRGDLSSLERAFIGVYQSSGSDFGSVTFADVAHAPPDKGWVKTPIDFEQVMAEIAGAFRTRNKR